MELTDLALPSLNPFASDYLEGVLETESYFDYDIHSKDTFEKRYEELMSRSFKREDTADYIDNYMSRFPESEAVKKNIEALRQPDTAVVIGGQQAGILTGPLYTIHKVISVIKLAEEQEQKLGRKIIPVFWIAGEDHDLAEINHIYTMKQGKPAKNSYPLYHPFKTMATDIVLDAGTAESWIQEIFETFGETEFTNRLVADLSAEAGRSDSLVDFFARLIHGWFEKYGLLLLDAGDPELRRIESDYFRQFISCSDKIAESVLAQQTIMGAAGYKRMIEMEPASANLFYYTLKNKERVLLEHEGSMYKGKNGEVALTKDELLETAASAPQQLSNNVVTRPLMQEHLFPVLAFISGPGEIAYWAELKKAFELFSIKMPPIVPRLNITLVEPGIMTDMQELGLDFGTVLKEGTEMAEQAFIDDVKDEEVEKIFLQLKENLSVNHQLLSQKAAKADKGLEPLLEKNRYFLESQLDFMYGKIIQSTKERNGTVLAKYRRTALSLFPLQSPQERIWNICYYLNKYGPDLIDGLMEMDYPFNNRHKLVFL